MKQLICILLFFLLTGCGTTKLVTYNSNVDIYVNNQYKGKGEVTIPRTGPPQKSHVVAKYSGREVGSTDIKRSVKFSTVLIGMYTYGFGFFLSWRYPEMVIIPTDNLPDEKRGFEPGKSIWDMPPGEWKR